MNLPIVTIVGRQNVGKSTLFNAIAKERRAIVDPLPGLTRDIITFNVSYGGASFMISDTPGLDISKTSELSSAIVENAMRHLRRSSVIIMLMENPSPQPFDLDLADIIRKLSLTTIIAVNKMDGDSCLENMNNFYETGFTDVLPVSALRRFNLNLLLDKIVENLPRKPSGLREPDLKISIVGRPNSGKSTLLNSLIGFDRAVVSDIPGTTRDSIDEIFTYHGKNIMVIDTAGLRRKRRISEDVEFYSMKRTMESIKKCDVAVHLVDAEQGLTETDKKISDEIIREKKPIIIAVNKWDSIEKDGKTFEKFKDRLQFKFYRAGDFPIISISAKNKQRISRLVDTALELREKASTKIETSKLNKIISRAQDTHRVPQLGGRIKVFYATQTHTIPPQFIFFVNNPELFKKDVIRYFEKLLQEELDVKGVPIIIHIEGRKKRER